MAGLADDLAAGYVEVDIGVQAVIALVEPSDLARRVVTGVSYNPADQLAIFLLHVSVVVLLVGPAAYDTPYSRRLLSDMGTALPFGFISI